MRFLMVLSIALCSGPLVGKDIQKAILDIEASPNVPDWQYFMNMDDGQREKLWKYHSEHGKKLGDWAWGWRLGWVRVCKAATKSYCHSVFKQALKDRALVVRAELATQIGRRYAGTGDQKMIRLLSSLYQDKRNFRAGKTLFIGERILYALKEIGGPGAKKAGTDLARTETSKAYWSRISKAM